MHEAKLYEENSFITLTYDDAHLPKDQSLQYEDYQKFMRRLRKARTTTVRFFMSGEYGEGFGRPHYHACLFNVGFPDKVFFSGKDQKLWNSDELTELWGKGFALFGNVTFETAAYVARYCVGKITGQAAERHYEVIDTETGEVRRREPEFAHMSLKPGIGRPWLEKYWNDVYPRGEVITNGRPARTPRYYDKLFEKADVDDSYARMVFKREQAGVAMFADNTPERLAVKEEVAYAKLKQYQRTL